MSRKQELRAEYTYLKYQGWEPWTLYSTTQAFARASCFYDHFAHFRDGIGACLASFCHFPALGRSSRLNGLHSLPRGLGAQARLQEPWSASFVTPVPKISPNTFSVLASASCSGRPSLTMMTAKHLLGLP